jgi:hypothetical protein
MFYREIRAYANSKLAQIYHARSLQTRHPKLRFVSICPSLVGTDLAASPIRELTMKFGYRVDGWGLASAFYALFSNETKEDFFTTGLWDYLEYWTGITPWMPGWISVKGVRDAIVLNLALSGWVGQRFFSGVGPRRSSVESYDMEIAEALWDWSYQTLSRYLPASLK